MNEFLAGLKGYPRAWRLVIEARLWPILLVPGLAALLYFPMVVFLSLRYGGDLGRYVRDHWLPRFLQHDLWVGLITVTLWLLGFYLGFALFRNVVMILYSPILGFISAKTEAHAGPGTQMAGADTGMLRAALRGIFMSLVSLALAIGAFVVCCVLQFIPVVGQLAMMVLLPVSQMFLAGQGFMDPALERRALGVRGSFRFAWRHRMRVLGCGCGFLLVSGVPVIGWFLGPTLGVVAGTLVALDVSATQPSPETRGLPGQRP